MVLKPEVIEKLVQIIGPTNVLTDFEDIYVYSFGTFFIRQKTPLPDAVVKPRSIEEVAKVRELAHKENFIIVSRERLSDAKLDKMVMKKLVILDTAPPPKLETLKEKLDKIKEVTTSHKRMIRRARPVGCWTLVLEMILRSRLISQCQECTICSGYCTVAPYFNNIETWSSKGRFLLTKGFIKGELEPSKKLIDIIYTCSLCGLCFAQCIQGPQIDSAILAARRKIVEKGLAPEEFKIIANNILEFGNPSGLPANQRILWSKGLPKIIHHKRNDILYWAGCTTSLRFPAIAKSTFNILKESGRNVTSLGAQEGCCGNLLTLTGLWNEAKKNAVKVVKKIKETGIATLVTGCSGCYRAFKKLYPELLGIELPFEVLHISQFIDSLIKKGELEANPLKLKVTYQDPCELGRHCNIYDEPRSVIKSIPHLQFLEMPFNRNNARCCGGGGGFLAFHPRVAINAAYDRMRMDALPLNVDAVITACPACYMNFSYAIKLNRLPVKTYDIAQLVELAMKLT